MEVMAKANKGFLRGLKEKPISVFIISHRGGINLGIKRSVASSTYGDQAFKSKEKPFFFSKKKNAKIIITNEATILADSCI
jgi:hypothetical protein